MIDPRDALYTLLVFRDEQAVERWRWEIHRVGFSAFMRRARRSSKTEEESKEAGTEALKSLIASIGSGRR
jgi:hypothetical protein